MADTLTPELCIIGGGPAGLAAAEAARALEAGVVLIERHRMGGSDRHAGSVASKALNAAARHAEAIRTAARFGIAAEDVRVHFGRIRDGIAEILEAIAPESSAERYRALGVEVVSGAAAFLDPRTIKVGETLVRPRRFILATGSRPVLPPIPGLDTVPYFTTDTIFTNARRPTHLLVIGSEAIGLEIAQSYRRLGSQVTLVAPGAVLADSDPELAEIALRRIGEEGVAIRQHAEVVALAEAEGGIAVTVKAGEGGAEETLTVSHILLAAGHAPDLEGLDLDKARIATRPDVGDLVFKGYLRTTNRRVYAVGDATGGRAYAHLAIEQARQAARSALLGTRASAGERVVPIPVFTDPEIAEVGMTEPEARRKLKDAYLVLRSSFVENHRARAERTTYGVAKLVCDRRGRLLGAGIVGPGAAELIALFALAIASGLSVTALEGFSAPYPTLSGIAGQLAAEFSRGREIGPMERRRLALARRLP